MKTLVVPAAVFALLVVTLPLRAAEKPEAVENIPTTVNITEMHLCCKGCTSAVEKAVAKVEGVTCKTSEDEQSTVLNGDNPKNLQKALDEIAAAGFCGKIENAEVAFQPIEFKEGNVHRLEVAHVHNCCMACTNAIKGAIEAVEGVKANTVKNKQVSFVVEGDFSPAELVKALQEAGFYPTLKGKAEKKL